MKLQDYGDTQGCYIFSVSLLPGLNKVKGVMVQYYTCSKHETLVKSKTHFMLYGLTL